MKKLIFAIILISPPFLKKLILKCFCRAKFGQKATIGWFSAVVGNSVVMGNYSTVKPLTLIRCDGEVKLGNYSEISSFSVIYGCSDFRVGDRCYIGPQTWINVSDDVEMGNKVGVGPRTMIFTHGSFLPYTEGYWSKLGKVTIKNNVSISSDVFIHPGVEIGDNVFINARSVISANVESGTVVEGFPSKVICPLEKLRRPVSPLKRDFLIKKIIEHFFLFLNHIDTGIEVIDFGNGQSKILRHKRHDYALVSINSYGEPSDNHIRHEKNKIIALINCENQILSLNRHNMIFFDFLTMKTSYSKNKIHRELYGFMRMYYGIVFEYEKA